ncbi:hypothetical protein Poli38472_008206 [Pythium oligandrum]|uniref:Thioesterase n=1 Tax=Pythium oligandrum TaxID=41045 RepID=A0A8K1FLS9_PYTOL|nr:hypothetical protein Poli38472_008206 [Pythium oligandrum]|eukprot:TMW65564.1 hypothetical protein Poli38472_008206 [Pythium oligandrum]
MVLRVFWNLGSGLLHHAVSKSAKAQPGMGVLSPVVWRARTGFLDCDINMHLNNSSFLYCMELARWHFAGAVGMLPTYFKNNLTLLVASQTIRYRHPIPPFHPYEIHTQVVHSDDDWMYLLQHFVCPTTGKMYAEGLCRATIRKGRNRVPWHKVYKDSTGLEITPNEQMPDVVKEFLDWDAASKVSMEAAEAVTRATASAKTRPSGVEKITMSWNSPQKSLDPKN